MRRRAYALGRYFMVVIHAATTIAYYVAGVLVVVVALSVGYEVVMRYIFNDPTVWVVQASRYILLYITFLSAPYILREDGHTRMTVIFELVGPRTERALYVGTSVLVCAVCCLLVWLTGTRTWSAYQFGNAYREGFTMPQAAVWVAMPVGFFLLAVQSLVLAKNRIQNMRDAPARGP